jgi:hypothetical protein
VRAFVLQACIYCQTYMLRVLVKCLRFTYAVSIIPLVSCYSKYSPDWI